ncbi:MAG: hypothetical protein WC011_00610 [Candidatus Paceibacterota bacterium]
MHTSRTLLIIGIWTAILPYLGFPSLIKNILFVITGFILIYISLVLYKNSKKETPIKRMFENFSENLPFRDKRMN